MKPVGLASTRISNGYAQKSPRSLQSVFGTSWILDYVVQVLENTIS